MASVSFPINSIAGANTQAFITLDDDPIFGGVKVTVTINSSLGVGDITGVFFDVENNNLAGLSIVDPATTNNPANPIVTATNLSVNNVTNVGGSSIQGNGTAPFDVGVAIGTTGNSSGDFYTTASFIVKGATLNTFYQAGQNLRFGVRLQSIGGTGGGGQTSRLVGTTPDFIPPNAPKIDPVTGDDRVNRSEKTAGVTVSGTAEANSTINVTWGSTTLTTTTNASGTWRRSFTSAQIPADSSSTISVTAKDAAGNTSTASTRTVAIDTIAPTVAIQLSDSALTFGETATVTFTFSEVPAGFDLSDIVAQNGTLTALTQSTDPKIYTATFTPVPNLNDATNVITVGTGYTDAVGNPGTSGSSPNYTINTLYSPLTLSSLGYISQTTFPTSSAYNPVTNPIVVQPIENTAAFAPRYFILPEIGQAFIQTIQLKNQGSAPTAPNTAIKISTTNSPLVVPEFVWNDLNNNNQLDVGDPNEVNSKVVFAPGQFEIVYTVTQSVAAGQTVNLKLSSKIVDPNSTLNSKQKVTFRLQDQAGTNDLGDATGNLTLYLTGGDGTAGTVDTGFRKAANSTLAFFNSLAPSTLAVDINLDGTEVNGTQSADVVRAAGTLIEGTGGASPNTPHFMGLPQLEFDVDQRLSGGGGTINSDPIDISQFQLVWNAAPNINTINFFNNSGSSAFSNTNTTPNDSLLELINANLFGEIYAIDQFTKDSITYQGQLLGNKNLPGGGTQPINQDAIAGKIGDGTLRVVTYTPPPDFQTFVNNLAKNYPLTSPQTAYQINISDPNSTLFWSAYNPTTDPRISVIQLQSTSLSTQLKIANGNTSGALDLSQTIIIDQLGNLAGANIVGTNVRDVITGSTGNDVINGGNGADVLNGWLGNDVLIGSNGADTFVFSVNSGSDTIQDLDGNDRIDLKALKISNPSGLDTNGNGRFDAGDTPYNGFATTINSGSTSSLVLDLTPFSNAQLPNTVTTSKITFFGVSQVSVSQFLFA
jgi:hypothetical protein